MDYLKYEELCRLIKSQNVSSTEVWKLINFTKGTRLGKNKKIEVFDTSLTYEKRYLKIF